MRQRKFSTSPKETKRALDTLWAAASRTDKTNTTTEFLRGLLTETEQLQLGRRLLIAQRLLEGVSWSHIRTKINVSPSTINLVQMWLKQSLPNYETVLKDQLKRTSTINNTKAPRQRYDRFSWEALRHKYPDHFLLWNLLADDSH
jgi:uncharacterized protein YerC